MEALNWLFQGNCKSSTTAWTKEENKKFESALAIYDDKTPDRWSKVAALIPGKSAWEVKKQYEELLEDVSDIEAGLFPIPGYLTTSPFSLKRSTSMARPSELDRKKGVPWTEDEHRRFLLGLQEHGKGDWRNISRNFVMSKTPTQVASHAQKYFLRQNSGGKDKRRPSIHDITTANLGFKDADRNPKSLLQHSTSFPLLQKSIDLVPKMLLDWSNSSGEQPFMVLNSSRARQNSYPTVYQGAYVRSN